jgi:hypothetical protein
MVLMMDGLWETSGLAAGEMCGNGGFYTAAPAAGEQLCTNCTQPAKFPVVFPQLVHML